MSLLKNFPSYRLERIVLERYGTFRDALSDLDDALNILFMVSNLTCTSVIDSDRVIHCRRLCREFQKYVTMTCALRKVFASIKGLYVQVEIDGVFPVFIIPYRPFQSVPRDVDQRVIKSFLEFYECLLSCVNRHLFHWKGYSYPPQYEESLEEKGFSVFDAFRLECKNNVSQLTVCGTEDSDFGVSDSAEGDKKVDHPNRLLEGMTFFLGREVPLDLFDFLIRSCGGNACWELPGTQFTDPKAITHYVYDRPNIPGDRRLDAEYVQPQWILDSINAGVLLPISLYLPGVSLPPHLSPFVNHENSIYRPHYQDFISEFKTSEVTAYTEKVIGQENTKKDKLDTTSQVASGDDGEEEEEEDKRQRALVPNDKLEPCNETQNRKLAKMMMRSKDRYRYERITRTQKKAMKTANRLLRRQEELMHSSD
ncbi:nucleolar protein pescadillo [Galdieria sulphuraria]|uniref:Nucleolar protein pescadillo n=1 Tax=Galdieria sulphuraria TaxID=130081 RepID=M2XMK7_GALSU|nr:nucleolar protein pescadillo [Galdieria sulphuraria]EME31407.1 nucleolar protein pescadillo [Galdieria sulphuraria]|eukprot:XP_005707927.1 nucleolar protein pescadillo [Galdieria sulphuraria]